MTKQELKTKIFESLGTASVCWDPKPAGVFDSNYAAEIGNELVKSLEVYELEVNKQLITALVEIRSTMLNSECYSDGGFQAYDWVKRYI